MATHDRAGAAHAWATIAVTGHRPNRLLIDESRIRRRMSDVLAAFRRGARRRDDGAWTEVHALSALAEGADRMFAEEALSLGFVLDVLLPFASSDYQTTFAETSATPRYMALLARASTRREMPGSLAQSQAAYEAMGRECVRRSACLVAVWDGKPAAGRGGTAEIVGYALARGKPVVWIDAARERRPRLLAAPAFAPLGIDEEMLMRIAARSRPTGPSRIARLIESA